MRLGVVLPTFSLDATAARRAAREAEDAGIDGCFCYDHLWPLGEPGRPAIAPFPLLGLLAVSTRTVVLGTLVARVGLVADEVLFSQLLTLRSLIGERLVAGLGTGDQMSLPEQRAYGLRHAPASERRDAVGALARRLVGEGVTTWVGGRDPRTISTARQAGAVPNLWAASAEELAAIARFSEVTWGGSLPADPEKAGRRLAGLAAAGASWAVFGWPGSAAPLLAAARAAGIAR